MGLTPRRNVRPETLSRRTSLYREAEQLMRRNLDRTLRIDDVARQLGTSHRQLQRIFAEVGKTTYRQRLREIRMLEAARMLARGDREAGDVAKAVGYRSLQRFDRAFARVFGAQPSREAPGDDASHR
jgi:AraC-like DNA-binding protein